MQKKKKSQFNYLIKIHGKVTPDLDLKLKISQELNAFSWIIKNVYFECNASHFVYKRLYAKYIQENNSTGYAFGITIQCITF